MLVPILKEDFYFLAKSFIMLQISYNSPYDIFAGTIILNYILYDSINTKSVFYELINKILKKYLNIYNKILQEFSTDQGRAFIDCLLKNVSTFVSSQKLPSQDYKGSFLLKL